MSKAPISSRLSQPTEQGNIYVTFMVILQLLLTAGLVLFVWRRDWENIFLTVTVMLICLVPTIISRRRRIFIPPEFQFIAAFFVFLSLYLGSGFDFYYRFWWWDLVLHTYSGFLL